MPPAGACYIGLDVGTSGCRAVAIDADGNELAAARTDLPPSSRPVPGASEQSPADWWTASIEVLGAVIEQASAPAAAIAVDGTSSTLLLCDTDGFPAGPALMYDDSRAAVQATRVGRHAPADSPAHGAGSALARLLYLLDRSDRRDGLALHQADWIAGRLLGRFGLSDENNALKLGYDPVARRWPDWIERLGIPGAMLPRVLPTGRVLGPVARDAARQLVLPTACVVVAGTTDSNAATLAAGVRRVGEAVTSLGTTLVLKVLSDRPVFAARFGVYSHRLGDRWLVGGASNSGGGVLRRYFSDHRLAELSQQIDPQRPTGLDYYPLPAVGERFPDSDPAKVPRLAPRPGDDAVFLQGMLEGIAAIERRGYRRLAELGAPWPRRVVTGGGGAINEAWTRIRARHLGLPVTRAAHTEAAYGAALLARNGALGGSAL